ncbi:hypothetical protein EB001_16260 [bacterium]|nr:hypothetical protein [bacterium]
MQVGNGNAIKDSLAATPNITFGNNTITVWTRNSSYKGFIIQGVASQSANLQEWQNSSGTTLLSVSSDGTLNKTGTLNIGPVLSFADPGVGNETKFVFSKTSDSAWITVKERSSDNTYYEFGMSDNALDGGDYFQWTMAQWTALGMGWMPIQLGSSGGKSQTLRFTGEQSTFYSNLLVPLNSPFYTYLGDNYASSNYEVNKWIPSNSTSINLRRFESTGSSATFNVDLSGYTYSGRMGYKITIDSGATTFSYSTYGGDSSSGSAITITAGSWQTLSNGVKIKIGSGALAGENWSFLAFPTPRFAIGGTVDTSALAVIKPIATDKGLVIKSDTSQTANLQEWQNSSGSNIGWFNPYGSFEITNSLNSASSSVGNRGVAQATTLVLKIQGTSSQSANLTEWQNNGGTVLSSINPLGYLSINKSYTSYPLEVNGSLYAKDATASNLYIQGGNNLIYPSVITAVGGTGWTAVTPNYAVSPDGTTTATRYTWSNFGNCYVSTSSLSNIANIFYTASMYVKPNNATSKFLVSLRAGDSSDYANAEFDSSTNTASYTQKIPTSNFSNGTANAIYVGNGWYRVWVTAKLSAALSNLTLMFTTTQNNGDVSIWGAQVEQGYYASAYIPTTNAAVTSTNNLYVPSGSIYSPSIQSIVSSTATLSTNGDTGGLLINTVAAANKGLVIKGVASQTADLQQWQTSGGQKTAWIDPNGQFTTGYYFMNLGGNVLNSGLVNIAPTGNIVPLLIQGISGQTADLQQWRNSAGSVQSRIDAYGRLGIATSILANSSGGYSQASIANLNTTDTNLIIKGYASQTATLQEWQNSSGTVLSSITNNGFLNTPAILENPTISATAATGTINYDLLTNKSVTYYTSNASANWTLNIRGNSTTTLDSLMAVGQSLTIVFMVTQGTTAYYQSGFQIDGTSVTPKWQGGTAPTFGNVSGVDAYSITIMKTASATFSVFESQTRFA